MQTIVILDSCGQSNIKFFIKEGDFSEFNNQYVNDQNCSEEASDFINSLKENAFDEFPLDAIEGSLAETVVIVCGFIP
jgi:hypothetical protein